MELNFFEKILWFNILDKCLWHQNSELFNLNHMDRKFWSLWAVPWKCKPQCQHFKMALMWQMRNHFVAIVWILIKYNLLLKTFSGSDAIFNWKNTWTIVKLAQKIVFCLIIVLVLYLFEVVYSNSTMMEEKVNFSFKIFMIQC